MFRALDFVYSCIRLDVPVTDTDGVTTDPRGTSIEESNLELVFDP